MTPGFQKTFTGHSRGHAEPFSDGQGVPPADAMATLMAVLDQMFMPLVTAIEIERPSAVLNIHDFTGRLPALSADNIRDSGSRARVLAAPFDAYTLTALRVIDHLLPALDTGQGPTHPGANLLLNLLIANGISYGDQRILWDTDVPFHQLTKRCAVAIWKRQACRAEIKFALVASTVVAIGNLNGTNIQGTWDIACSEARTWLNNALPNLSWPESGDEAIRELSALMTRWLRFCRPPFLLAAGSPRMTSPTTGRASLLRLANDSGQTNCDEALVFAAPKPRGKCNLRFIETPLSEAIDLVHEWANPAKHVGEDWALMAGLRQKVAAIDCSQDLSAPALITWVDLEAALWNGSFKNRLQVSSLSTYVYLLTPAFVELKPIHNLRDSPMIWHDFIELLRTPRGVNEADNTEKIIADRFTAARRFTGKLLEAGWEIPSDLFFDSPSIKPDGMRKSAASVLVLKDDRARIKSLMERHFAAAPLDSVRAGLYVELRFSASQRSMETAVLPIEGIDPFGNLIITTDGFSHLKSDRARRIQALPVELVDTYKQIAKSVVAAEPDSEWIFLMGNRTDWRFVVQLEQAFSTALKQVCLDPTAVPHTSRAVAPLEAVIPGWEDVIRKLINGHLAHADIEQFLRKLGSLGFTNLAQVQIQTGHGHPLTYLEYYFSVWDLLHSFYFHRDALHRGTTASLVARMRPRYKAAFLRDRSRKGESFNGEQYLLEKELAALKLPQLTWERTSSALRATSLKSRTAKNPSLAVNNARYLAARFAQHDRLAAADNFGLDTPMAARMESLFSNIDTSILLKRHQSKPSLRGRKAEIAFLRSDDGISLTLTLLSANKLAVESLGSELTPLRTYKATAPSVSTLQTDLRSHLQCLPAALGILIQFRPGLYDSSQLVEISKSSPRIRIGACDSDIGARPRLSVIDLGEPGNFVLRARRTSVTRCLIAATQLLN